MILPLNYTICTVARMGSWEEFPADLMLVKWGLTVNGIAGAFPVRCVPFACVPGGQWVSRPHIVRRASPNNYTVLADLFDALYGGGIIAYRSCRLCWS